MRVTVASNTFASNTFPQTLGRSKRGASETPARLKHRDSACYSRTSRPSSPALRRRQTDRVWTRSGNGAGTDKARDWHGYLEFYERFFASLRDQPVRLLEIGVFRGQSVKMWSEYFAVGQIIGADIDPAALQYAADRIIIEIADQSNIAHLTRLGVTHGPFDIVVDDGSHLWNLPDHRAPVPFLVRQTRRIFRCRGYRHELRQIRRVAPKATPKFRRCNT